MAGLGLKGLLPKNAGGSIFSSSASSVSVPPSPQRWQCQRRLVTLACYSNLSPCNLTTFSRYRLARYAAEGSDRAHSITGLLTLSEGGLAIDIGAAEVGWLRAEIIDGLGLKDCGQFGEAAWAPPSIRERNAVERGGRRVDLMSESYRVTPVPSSGTLHLAR